MSMQYIYVMFLEKDKSILCSLHDKIFDEKCIRAAFIFSSTVGLNPGFARQKMFSVLPREPYQDIAKLSVGDLCVEIESRNFFYVKIR